MKINFKSLAVASIGFLSTQAMAATTNVSVNPLGLLIGSANATIEFAVSDKVTLGPSFSFSKLKSGTDTASAWGVGGLASIYLSNNIFTDSWVLQPFAAFGKASANSSSVSGVSAGANIGYSWFWESGFNINLGFGAQYVSYDLTALGLTSISGVLPSGNFSLGYAF